MPVSERSEPPAVVITLDRSLLRVGLVAVGIYSPEDWYAERRRPYYVMRLQPHHRWLHGLLWHCPAGGYKLKLMFLPRNRLLIAALPKQLRIVLSTHFLWYRRKVGINPFDQSGR